MSTTWTSDICPTVRVDWRESRKRHVFKVDLPGFTIDGVSVEVGQDGEIRFLQIGGERTRKKDKESYKWHLLERGSGKFLRRFVLPKSANVDEMKVRMENGVLAIIVPKEEGKKPKVRSKKAKKPEVTPMEIIPE
jgi:HSP20 family protein